MRIHSLEIENITSLKGKHHIDFDNGLHGEELFAITGPTGAGKSSLLSSISLSLYGKTYKGSLAGVDFVTTGMPFGRTSLNFSLGGKNYEANWTIKVLKKNGEPIKNPKPQRELICEGISLEHTQVSDILGLDFDQFCKTIILNQGEFAKFLHSSFRERKDIIEKLYRTGELSQISKILKEKVKKEESDYALQSLSFEKSLPYTEEEVKEIDSELKDKIEILKIHEGLIDLYSPAHKNLSDLFRLLNEEKENQDRIVQSQQKLNKHIENWNEIKGKLKLKHSDHEKAHSKLKTEAPKIREAITHQNNLEHGQKEKTQLLKELEEKTKKQLKVQTEIVELKDSTEQLTTQTKELYNSYNHKKLFHSKSRNEIYTFKEGIGKLKGYLTEKEKIQSQLEIFKKQKDQQNKIIKKSQTNLNGILEFLQTYLDESDSDLTTYLSNFRRSREAQISLWAKFSSNSENLIEQFNRREIRQGEIKEFNENLNLLKARVSELEILKKKEELNLAIELCHKEAIDKNECPVCLSKDLTKIQRLEVKKFNHSELIESENEYNRTKIKLDELSKTDGEQDKKIRNLLDSLNKQNDQLFPSLNEELNWSASSEVTQGIKILKELHQKNKEDAQATQEKLEKAKAELDQENTSIEESKSILTELNEQEMTLKEEIEQADVHIDTFLNTWKDILSEKSPKDVVTEFESDIEVFNNYVQLEQKLDSSDEKLKLFINQNTELNSRIGIIQSRLKELKNSIEIDKNFVLNVCGEQNPIHLLEEMEKNEQEARKQFEKHRDDASSIEKLKNNEEQSIRVYKEQIEELHNLQKLTISKLKDSFESLYSYNNKIPDSYELRSECIDILNASKNWMQLPATATYEDLLPILETRLETSWSHLMEKLKDVTLDLKTTVATNKTKIADYNKKLKERAGLEKEIEVLKKSLDLKKKLLEVFGKDEFRSYALGLLEKELVMGANEELNQLCDGRYQLQLLPGKGGQMEFFVMDQWRESTLRKISTLSGGETFLVSLAMALALAELTRGQNEIDSFFIDEGFGHLDVDSIDEVHEVLMSIQNRGKQIGIISHVKALTDRIPVNLRLQKSSLGESQTQFVYN